MIWLGVILVILGSHWWMYETYRRVYGRRLKLRYAWAALGLLLFMRREPGWEVKPR